MWVRAERNQFDNLPIQLLGEGYQAHLVVENFRGISLTHYEAETAPEVDDGMYMYTNSVDSMYSTVYCRLYSQLL